MPEVSLLDYQRLRPPTIGKVDLDVWREYIRDQSGLEFPDSRLHLLVSRLWSRMQTLGMDSYLEYQRFIAFNNSGGTEWQLLLDDLLNHETCFFRHGPSFHALRRHVLPDLMRRPDVRLRLWSAGCSFGQEVYSMALIASDANTAESKEISVLGTDVSRPALCRAASANYRATDLRSVPEDQWRRLLDPVGETLVVKPEIRAITEFQHMNLVDTDYSITGQDVIFCQNVLIYFSNHLRRQVVDKLCEFLNPGGYLFLGPVECPDRVPRRVQPVRLPDVLLFQKQA